MELYQIKLMQAKGYEYSFSDVHVSVGEGTSEPLKVVGRKSALDLVETLSKSIRPALPGTVMIEQVS